MRPAKREMEQNILKMGRRGFVHIAQCRGFVTYGSNPWILRHLTRSVKFKPGQGGHEVLFAATSGNTVNAIATNRTLCPPGHGFSFTDLVRLCNIQ